MSKSVDTATFNVPPPPRTIAMNKTSLIRHPFLYT